MTDAISASEPTEQILEAVAAKALIKKLRIAGHEVRIGKAGDYLVTRWGHSRHCMDFDSLRDFAHQVLGVI